MKKNIIALALVLTMTTSILPVNTYATTNINYTSTIIDDANTNLAVNTIIPNTVIGITSKFPSIKEGMDRKNNGDSSKFIVNFYENKKDGLTSGYFTTENGIPSININMVQTKDEFDDRLLNTIIHETTHAILHESIKANLPIWFSEGFPEAIAGGYVYNNKFLQNGQASSWVQIGDSQSINEWPFAYRLGYIATMYTGYLANNKSEVTQKSINKGLDNIFSDLLKGMTFEQSFKNRTGLEVKEFENLFKLTSSNPNKKDLIDFTNKLTSVVKLNNSSPAGSLILDDLNSNISDIKKHKDYDHLPANVIKAKSLSGKVYDNLPIKQNMPKEENKEEKLNLPNGNNYTLFINEYFRGQLLIPINVQDYYIENGIFEINGKNYNVYETAEGLYLGVDYDGENYYINIIQEDSNISPKSLKVKFTLGDSSVDFTLNLKNRTMASPIESN